MSTGNRVTESRELKDFDRVILRDFGEPIVEQGEQESLTIDTDPEILPRVQTKVEGGTLTLALGGSWFDKLGDALTTSLTRKPIRYILTIRNLAGLEVRGAASVAGSGIETDAWHRHCAVRAVSRSRPSPRSRWKSICPAWIA
jgi:hypothetical protein